MSEHLLYLDNLDGVISAEQHRMMALNAFMTRSTNLSPSNSFQATPGVKSSATDSCKVTQTAAGANMAVDISSGQVYVQPADPARFGCYVWTNTDVVNITIAASDATLNRIDVVGIQVTDTQYGDGADACQAVVIMGVPAGTPAVPVLPDGFTPIAQVLVSAVVTTILNAKISQYAFAYGHPAAAGGWMTLGAISNGSIPVTYPTNTVPGQIVVDQVTGVIQYASGYYANKWRPLGTTGLVQTWNPVLTATTTNPVQGTGTGLVKTAIYRYITPKIVWFSLTFHFGTTSRNAGSGRYHFSLPLPAASGSVSNCGYMQGRWQNATDGTTKFVTGLKVSGSDTFSLSYFDIATHTTNTVSDSAPFVPGAGSGLQLTGIYEVA